MDLAEVKTDDLANELMNRYPVGVVVLATLVVGGVGEQYTWGPIHAVYGMMHLSAIGIRVGWLEANASINHETPES